MDQRQFLILLIFLAATNSITAQACPKACMCVPYANGTVDARCHLEGLNGFPKGLPPNIRILQIVGINVTHIIPNVTRADLSPYKNLEELEIVNANVELVMDNAFADLGTLRRLKLNHNRITKLHADTFQNLTELTELFINDNPIKELDAGTFHNQKRLIKLHLQNMTLVTLSDGIFTGLSSLELLDIDNNKIQHIEDQVFSPLKSIQGIDLSFNKLTKLPSTLESIVTRMRLGLKILGNPLICNCEIAWFKANRAVYAKMGRNYCYIFKSGKWLRFPIGRANLKCSKPDFTNTTCRSAYTIKEGASIDLGCPLIGEPFPDVTWLTPSGVTIKLGEPSNDTNYEINMDGTLSIASVALREDGEYTLSTVNREGSLVFKLTLNVEFLTTTSTTTEATTMAETTAVTTEMTTEVTTEMTTVVTTETETTLAPTTVMPTTVAVTTLPLTTTEQTTQRMTTEPATTMAETTTATTAAITTKMTTSDSPTTTTTKTTKTLFTSPAAATLQTTIEVGTTEDTKSPKNPPTTAMAPKFDKHSPTEIQKQTTPDNTGAIVGGVLGALAGILAIVAGVISYLKFCRKSGKVGYNNLDERRDSVVSNESQETQLDTDRSESDRLSSGRKTPDSTGHVQRSPRNSIAPAPRNADMYYNNASNMFGTSQA